MTVDVNELNLARLREEYELSQWALTWALHKLGGTLIITPQDVEEFNKSGRIWYSQREDEGGKRSTKVEFIEEGRLILPGGTA